jgi:two-component sensor histidine kinase
LLSPVSLVWFDSAEHAGGFAVFLATGLVTAATAEALHRAFFRATEANSMLSAANRRIAASEHEKELLLQELTHRFKNDLANIAGVLRLQARGAADAAARSELLAASERVHLIGRVHRQLGRAHEAAVLDVRDFLAGLCDDLRAAKIGARPIALSVRCAEARLPFADAITLGMIVNELVANALKHAFPGERPGTVAVSLQRAGEEYALEVADDGVGGTADAGSGSGLGVRLTQAMARQLGGTFSAESGDRGRTCRVRFPARPAACPGRGAA